MKKIAQYLSFIAAGITDATIFFTSNSYTQLILAIIFYVPLIYFAFKLFPRKVHIKQAVVQGSPNPNVNTQQQNEISQTAISGKSDGTVDISDINKRAFLKIIGATGLSFFVSSLISRRFGSILGTNEPTTSVSIKDPAGNVISPAKNLPTDNYKISEVDYGINTFYGFIDNEDGWFILKEDVNEGTYRYVKGDSNFQDNWGNRTNLNYDYYNRVFPKD